MKPFLIMALKRIQKTMMKMEIKKTSYQKSKKNKITI